MIRSIEKRTGVSIVPITYDGTSQPKNDVLVPYLTFAAEKMKRKTRKDTAS